MSTIKDKTLIEALSYCDLNVVPEEDTKEYIWIKALALVKKADGSSNYAVCERDKESNPKIVKDFGSVAAIVKIEKFFPFMLLDKQYIPVFNGRNANDNRIKWLRSRGEKGELESLQPKELELKVIKYAINDALAASKNL